jgi:DNA-binding transcriptional regulator GbsR (MarR family)
MSSDNSVRIHDDSDHAATDIRESSSTTIQLVHALVRTGAIAEIARAIFETTVAIRDIANEVNETVKDLKEQGTIKNIASTVAETTNETRNTIEIAKATIETDNTKRIDAKQRTKRKTRHSHS